MEIRLAALNNGVYVRLIDRLYVTGVREDGGEISRRTLGASQLQNISSDESWRGRRDRKEVGSLSRSREGVRSG